jgi:hypothetical protein
MGPGRIKREILRARPQRRIDQRLSEPARREWAACENFFRWRARRNEPQSSMATNLIVGGLIVGLVALEIASHHHNR